MSASVTDESAFGDRKIRLAARVIGKSVQRLAVFKAIYFGKKTIKTQEEIRLAANLKTKKRVLEEGKKLATGRIIVPIKLDGETAYQKIDFYYLNQKAIISLVKRNIEGKIKLLSNPITGAIEIHLTVHQPKVKSQAIRVTVDDIDSFIRVRKIPKAKSKRYPEEEIKNRINNIIGEPGKFQDWGGDTKNLDLIPQEQEGTYGAQVIPTQIGQYTVVLKGTVSGQAIDGSIDLDIVGDPKQLSFPVGSSNDQISSGVIDQFKTAITDLTSQVDDAKAAATQAQQAAQSAQSIKASADGAYMFGMIGVSIGVAGIVLAVIALSRKEKVGEKIPRF